MHVYSRHKIATLAYCLMPDHIHFLWCGLSETSDQQLASKFFRSWSNKLLMERGVEWQRQAFDHVLRDFERDQGALNSTISYILENPVRKKISNDSKEYPFSGAVMAGVPDFLPFLRERYWKVMTEVVMIR